MKKLIQIQGALKAPKSQTNNFGKYNYRNVEDILEAVKPLLIKHECTLFISDEIILIGARFYVMATCTFSDGKDKIMVQAQARESEIKKGMDSAQITGAASSYARKYALNGLFLIDDTKDADFNNTSKEYSEPVPKVKPKIVLIPSHEKWQGAVDFIKKGKTIEELKKYYSINVENAEILQEQAIEEAFREKQK